MAGIPQSQRNTLIDTNFTTVYIALVTVIGTDSAAGTEVTGSGYARQLAAFDAAAAGATANTDLETWTATGGNYGTVVGVEGYTAVTAGTRIFWAPLSVNRVVNDSDTLEIAAGAVTYSWSS